MQNKAHSFIGGDLVPDNGQVGFNKYIEATDTKDHWSGIEERIRDKSERYVSRGSRALRVKGPDWLGIMLASLEGHRASYRFRVRGLGFRVQGLGFRV